MRESQFKKMKREGNAEYVRGRGRRRSIYGKCAGGERKRKKSVG